MTFSVRIHNTFDNDHPVKGTASVTMDGMFAVHGVKIMHSNCPYLELSARAAA